MILQKEKTLSQSFDSDCSIVGENDRLDGGEGRQGLSLIREGLRCICLPIYFAALVSDVGLTFAYKGRNCKSLGIISIYQKRLEPTLINFIIEIYHFKLVVFEMDNALLKPASDRKIC